MHRSTTEASGALQNATERTERASHYNEDKNYEPAAENRRKQKPRIPCYIWRHGGRDERGREARAEQCCRSRPKIATNAKPEPANRDTAEERAQDPRGASEQKMRGAIMQKKIPANTWPRSIIRGKVSIRFKTEITVQRKPSAYIVQTRARQCVYDAA